MNIEAVQQRTFGNALKWSYVMDGGRQAITTILAFVLAGVLGPAAFGTVAMATVYILLINLIMQQGMIPAIIQRRNLKPEHLDSAFWMIMMTSVVLAVISFTLSGWWASVNQLPELRAIIVALSLTIPIKGLVLVQEALLRREMNFRPLAIRANTSVVIGGGVGIVLAFQGYGVWSLVAQQLATGVVDLVVLWSISPWRPRVSFSLPCAKELLSFSATSSLASFGLFVNTRSDALLIGLLFGPAAVGLYRFAIRLIDLVIDTAVRSLQAVSLPELSRLQDDRKEFSRRLVEMLRLSSILALPALGILGAASGPLMAMIGPEWTAASAPLKVLCLVGAVRALTFFNGPMLQAIGRPKHLAAMVWGAAVLSTSAFLVAGLLLSNASTDSQLMGISLSRAILYGVVFFSINMGILVRVTKASGAAIVRAVLPAATAALAALAAGEAFQLVRLVQEWSPLPALAGTVMIAALMAAATLFSTDRRCRSAVLARWQRLRTLSPSDETATDVAATFSTRSDDGSP